ncbi:MAG: hypothetical protein IJX65_02510 [Alistipes sp.]|nr:hypothetical protein [Alistipes sp.]
MSQNDIDQIDVAPDAADATSGDAADSPAPEMEQVVITMPAKLKRALIATVEFFRSLFTGEIIINPTVSKGYDYLAYIALMLLVSILTLFSSLHLQIRENRLTEHVRLLGERAVRAEEQRVKATTHSAIVKTLEQRGIPLKDSDEPVTIIKNEQ